MNWSQRIRRYGLTGLLILVPAWGTFLILRTLFVTIDGLIVDLFGAAIESDIPGLGILTLLSFIVLVGVIATRLLGQRMLLRTDGWLQRIPVVRTVYLTLKGMTDLFNFRSRFGASPVVVFPFPREGLWALGFVMGPAPDALQVAPLGPLVMVFVPTAIHPFTGYLAFVPRHQMFPVHLPPEDAMKMEFSAGLYRPKPGWLRRSSLPNPADRVQS